MSCKPLGDPTPQMEIVIVRPSPPSISTNEVVVTRDVLADPRRAKLLELARVSDLSALLRRWLAEHGEGHGCQLCDDTREALQ
jgi:hypothetical protein